jgi:hypothetical protein
VNATDASGLQKEDTLAHRDPETPGEKVETLKKNKFDFHGGEGTVNVYTDATVSAKGKVSSDNNIWLEFIVKGSKEKNPVKDAHWLQFVESYKIRKNGEEGSGSDTVAGRYHKYGYGEWYVDTISKDKTKPFYDQPEKAAKRRTPTEISIYDRPDIDANEDLYPEIGARFDAYLVDDGKVYYHVHWERVNRKGDKTYENISGEPTDRLPWYALGGSLPGGWQDYDVNKLEYVKLFEFDNPIKGATRLKWLKEFMGKHMELFFPMP